MKKQDPNETEQELRERLKKFSKKASDGLFDPESSDFDETELASGSPDLLDKTDAELFPEEIEEHTPEERRQKIISDNQSRHSKGS